MDENIQKRKVQDNKVQIPVGFDGDAYNKFKIRVDGARMPDNKNKEQDLKEEFKNAFKGGTDFDKLGRLIVELEKADGNPNAEKEVEEFVAMMKKIMALGGSEDGALADVLCGANIWKCGQPEPPPPPQKD